MMSHHWSLILALIYIFLFQISSVHSTLLTSETISHIMDENDEYQRTHNAFMYFIKNILDEPNQDERTVLLNRLREYLNRMCIAGYFGASHADACQRVSDFVHQSYINNHLNNDENSDTSSEQHGIQKRFFCNSFTGCKSAAG